MTAPGKPARLLHNTQKYRKLMRVISRDGTRCWLCHGIVDVTLDTIGNNPMRPSLDHVIEQRAQGMHELSNLRLAHWACNDKRSNPRLQPWLRRWEDDGGAII